MVGPDNKKIGGVSDILFDKTGKFEADVVSVGGSLGMGSKDVVLAPSSFDVVPAATGSPPGGMKPQHASLSHASKVRF